MPELKNVVLYYHQDDDQMIKIDYHSRTLFNERNEGVAKIKLPEVGAVSKKEWKWHVVNFINHPRLREIVSNHRTVNPVLDYYEMNISYQVDVP
ncbi:MAG: hypothetical protein ACE5J3_13360, partial [Methanosarcinales archaeon]